MTPSNRPARGPGRRPWWTLPAALLLAAALPLPSAATLGETTASVEADRARVQARLVSSTTQPRWVVHELVSASGIIREYARPDGVIFAVTWSGQVTPVLEPLLGRFLADFRAAQPGPVTRMGRRSARVAGNDVVVETWGIMRAFQGRAWVPSLLPAGVVADDLE